MGYKSTLQMLIDAKNNAGRVLNQVTGQVKKVGDATNASTGKANAQLGKMVNLVRGAAAAYGITMVKTMADAGRASIAVEDSFRRLNKNGEQLLATMRKTSGGLLDDTSLQKIANKMQAIGLSAGKMGEVLDLSMKLAAQSGQDYLDVTQRLTQALITGETESFKTLGILVDSKQALARFAEENGRTVESLSKTEQAQAKVNEALRVGNQRFGQVDTTKFRDEMKKAETAAQNAWDTISRGAFFVLNDVSKFFNTMHAGARGIGQSMRIITDATGKPINDLIDNIRGVPEPVILAAASFDELMEATRGLGKDAKIAIDLTNAQTEAMSGLADVAARLASELKPLEQARVDAERAKERLDNLKELFKALDDIQKLEVKGAQKRDALDNAQLDALRKQVAFMRESGQVFDGNVAQWQAARADGALNAIAGQARGILNAMRGIDELTAKDAIRTLFGLGPAKTKPQKTPRGPSGPKPIDQLPALEEARRNAELDLLVTKNLISERERIITQFNERATAIRESERSEDEKKKAFAILDLEFEKFIEDEKARAREESDRRKADSAKRLADAEAKANRLKMQSDKQRAAAQKAADRAFQQSVDAGIGLTAQGLKLFAKTRRAMNIIDAARETAQSIKAFASGNIAGGIGHALAAASFVKAAATAGRQGGGGGGGGISAPSGGAVPAGDARFDDATTPQQEGGGNIIINVSGFAGDEEKLGAEVVRLVNLGAQGGAKVNGIAVDDSRREGF